MQDEIGGGEVVLKIHAEVENLEEAKELLRNIEALTEKHKCELTLIVQETESQELYRPTL